MLKIKSVKQQTLVLLVSLTLGLAIAFSSLAVVTAFMVEDAVLSNLIDEQAALIKQHHKRYGEYPEISSNFLHVYASEDDVPTWAKKRIARTQMRGEIFTPDGTHYHYKKLVLDNNTKATPVLLAEVSRLLAVTNQPDIFALFIFMFLIAIALAVWLAITFSQRIVQPVLTLTSAVKLNETTSANIPMPKLDFELGYLADALQSRFSQLDQLLEREKSFANNVSHELRTPLTVLKNSCALIEQRGFKNGDLLGIKSSCEQMAHIVDVLLALARAESMELQPCNATLVLEQVILRCETLPRENFQVHFAVPGDLILLANPRLLELLFFNLLRNAAEHASEPELTISIADNTLLFENSMAIEPPLEVTSTGTKAIDSQGIGQGLYLVARIIERFGWQLDVQTANKKFRVMVTPV